jgi:outer membrane protein
MKQTLLLLSVAGSVAALGGCGDDLFRDNTMNLRSQIIDAHRRELSASGAGQPVEVTQPATDSYLNKDPKRIQELDTISGPNAYRKMALLPGDSLDNQPTPTAALSLRQALRMAATNNVDVRIAQVQPAISEAQVVTAEAAFDAVFFTETNFSKNDLPQQRLSQNGIPFTSTSISRTSDTALLNTGIRKNLETGGQVTLSTGFNYTNDKSPGVSFSPDPAFISNLLLGIQQPLLRNFGTYVNRSQINIAQNAARRDVLSLHNQLLTTLADTEQAYWSLVFAREQLAIQQRLLGMTIEARDRVKQRQILDVNPVQIAQAQSFVERRRGDIIRAQRAIRDASDTLKRLINDPSLPIAGETLIVPSDEPVEMPVTYNLLDAVTASLQRRPEVRAALLNIDDASIRQAVADNQRLPLLVLNAQMQYHGMNKSTGEFGSSFEELTEGKFIEYVIGFQFEAPIGNRAAEADYKRSRLERQQSVVGYQKAVQDVVRDVKQSLRGQQVAYTLIGVTRDERRAAAENLRVLEVRERENEALTPEFLLDLKLSTQQRVADAETREVQSIVDYNISIIKLRQAIGTLLEHDQIEFAWPQETFAPDPNAPADPRAARDPGIFDGIFRHDADKPAPAEAPK